MVDEYALVRMLEAGELSGAGLDVFEQEPIVSDRLVASARAGKAKLLPHMGSATHEGRIDMGEKAIVNIKAFMDGHRPPDRVLSGMQKGASRGIKQKPPCRHCKRGMGVPINQ